MPEKVFKCACMGCRREWQVSRVVWQWNVQLFKSVRVPRVIAVIGSRRRGWLVVCGRVGGVVAVWCAESEKRAGSGGGLFSGGGWSDEGKLEGSVLLGAIVGCKEESRGIVPGGRSRGCG